MKAVKEGWIPFGYYGPETCRWATPDEMRRFGLRDCPMVHIDESKEAILAAGEAAGGEGGLTAYLARLAVENSSAYAGLLGKILPSVLAASDSDGGKVQITFRRIIVHPGGREEIEGATPKALPAPEPDETKAIEP